MIFTDVVMRCATVGVCFFISHVYLSLCCVLLIMAFVSLDSAVEEETSSKTTGHMTGSSYLNIYIYIY